MNSPSATTIMPAQRRRRVIHARLAAAASAVLILTACGGGTGGGTGSGAGAPTAGPNPPPVTGGAPVVTVVEKEFSIQLSETRLTPGIYTFRVQNQGSSPHDLTIAGPGMEPVTSPVLNGGETTDMTVTLHPGTHQIWCSVDNHRAQGMDTTVTVS